LKVIYRRNGQLVCLSLISYDLARPQTLHSKRSQEGDRSVLIDATVPIGIADVGGTAHEFEQSGYDGVWVGETQNEPFMQLLQASEATNRVVVGASVVIAFARSPMTVAYAGYDLARYSHGRFVLGLGSQVKQHIERRFSMPWSQPAARMREFVLALRAIWRSWDSNDLLRFDGDFYRHTLMTPFFAPVRHDYGPPPIFLAGVGPKMIEVAGEVGDGFINHGFTTPRYIREVTMPALIRGRRSAGFENLHGYTVTAPALIAVGRDDEQIGKAAAALRTHIGFYASTPAYRSVLELHGWEELQPELQRLAREGRWADMASQITDEILHEVGTVGDVASVSEQLRERWGEVAERITLTVPAGSDATVLSDLVDELSSTRVPMPLIAGERG
jgi:probable F420-dependent oxidoreductase